MIKDVVAELSLASKIALVAHINPDADSLGSMLALGRALEILGKTITYICQDDIPKVFQFLPGTAAIIKTNQLDNFDLIITLDCGDLKMTGLIEPLRLQATRRNNVINIDHHLRSDLQKLARLNLVIDNIPSTAMIVLELIDMIGIKINSQIATNLLAGIYNDTGGFKHANTTASVLQIAARLLSAGGKLNLIDRHVIYPKTPANLRLLGIILSRLKFQKKIGLIASALSEQDFSACKAQKEDVAGCLNLMLGIPEARIALLAFQLDANMIKVNLRTPSTELDMAQIARLFDGGGLKKSAGFTIKGNLILDNDRWEIIQINREPVADDSSHYA